MSTTYDLLRHAIQAKLQVLATYGNRPRKMCPHVLGTKDGEAHILVYQFSGTTSTGQPSKGWKCLLVNKLSNVSVRSGPWHTDPYAQKRAQKCVDVIDVSV